MNLNKWPGDDLTQSSWRSPVLLSSGAPRSIFAYREHQKPTQSRHCIRRQGNAPVSQPILRGARYTVAKLRLGGVRAADTRTSSDETRSADQRTSQTSRQVPGRVLTRVGELVSWRASERSACPAGGGSGRPEPRLPDSAGPRGSISDDRPDSS